MEYIPLELTLISAKDLKDVNLFTKMDVYAVVSLSGDPYQNHKAKTPVDRDGGTNPTWNFPMKFTINESAARQNRLNLEIKLRSERMVSGDKDVGVVHVPVNELLDNPGDGKSSKFVSYQVRKPSGKPKGSLNLSYKFGEKVTAPAAVPSEKAFSAGVSKDEPVMAYPPPAAASSSVPPYAVPYPPPHGGYPPPPPPPPQYAAGYGYPPPPYRGAYPQAYGGYPPPQPGYGYPPVQQPAKKNNFGMGLGAGLLGGALGGLLIGDMISDAGAYDAGYDAGGFDGGFGF